MNLDAAGQFIEIDAPKAVSCTVCDSRAERLSSAYQGEGIAYHNYYCRADDCPASGLIVEYEGDESGERRRVGPVFGDRDLTVRLATRVHPEVWEVAP